MSPQDLDDRDYDHMEAEESAYQCGLDEGREEAEKAWRCERSASAERDAARAAAKTWKMMAKVQYGAHERKVCREARAALENIREGTARALKVMDAARAEAETAWRCEKEAAAERDGARAELKRVTARLQVVRAANSEMGQQLVRNNDLTEDFASLERLYAKAIERASDLEKTLDAVRTESTRQTEEIRALKTRLAPEPPRERPYRTDPFAGVD